MSLDTPNDSNTEGWKWIKAKDFMIFNPRESVKKGTVVKNIPMDKIEPNTKEISSYDETEYKGGVKFRNGDTLMARITPCLENGKISQVSFLEDNEIGCGSTEFIVLREKQGFSDKEFVYYLSNSEFFKEPAIKSMVGSSGRQRVQRDVVENLDIFVPPLEVQIKIGKILSYFDEKIAINKKINKNLFNIASSIQTEWMINFTPFKSEKFKSSSFGLIPENWNVGKLGDVIELLDSKRIPLSGQQRENMEKIYPYYGAASLMDYVEDYIFDGVYLLMGEDGTVVDDKGFPILQYVWGKFWVNNHAHILKGKNGFNVESLYLLLSKTNIQSIVTGAVQAKVNQSNLKSIEIIIPPAEVMEKFNKLIKPFFDTIRSNNDEIKELQKLRDTLLPKLMSGEIDVSKINCDF